MSKKINKSVASSPPTRSKQETNAQRTGNENATNLQRIRNESATLSQRIRNESATNKKQIRYAFAPMLQQFRAHTKKNEARLWIPIETSLLSRYEFASCSPQSRYIFVAILLYCGANGISEIPLDAKFMSSVLVADFRTVENSFVELLSKNLLQERKEREEKTEKKSTDRQDEIAPQSVSVDSQKSFSEDSENKQSNGNEKGGQKGSQFTIDECLKYAEICQSKGDAIQNPKGLANHLFKTGEADSFILATLYPEKAAEKDAAIYGEPTKFTDEPCRVCFGAKMADLDGNGFRKCPHCQNEKGKATGYEPKGENENE